MDAAPELGRNPVSKLRIQPEYGDEQADAGRDCRTRLTRSNFRHEERGQGDIHFSCSADQVQDWQPYPVEPYSYYMCDHKYRRPDSHVFLSYFSPFCLFGNATHCRFLFVSFPTSYVLSFRMMFFYLVTTGWIFDISLCENSINQSINQSNSKIRISRVRLSILLVVSWKINISLSPFAPEKLASQDGFGSPVPRQPAHLHTYSG